MTVSELIVLLQARRFRGDMRIVTPGFDEFEYADVTTVQVIRVKLSDGGDAHIAEGSRRSIGGKEFREPFESELTEVVEINF